RVGADRARRGVNTHGGAQDGLAPAGAASAEGVAGTAPGPARVPVGDRGASRVRYRGGMTNGFETLAIHAGQDPDPVTGAVVPPIYATSTYKQDGVGGLRGGYEYSRSAN